MAAPGSGQRHLGHRAVAAPEPAVVASQVTGYGYFAGQTFPGFGGVAEIR